MTKRILVVGATGDIGRAVADAFAAREHQVLRASRKAPDPALRVDIADPSSIRALYARIDRVHAVVSAAGDAKVGALPALTDEDFAFSLANKLMGQVNLVRFGLDHVEDGGAFVLTAGIYATKPPPGVPALALVNGALESFARGASQDLPRGLRLITISPPWINETAARVGQKGALSAAANAEHYVRAVESGRTGEVVYPT
jgi:NAD(P)-dependent dehydrogenase (short-subunit alcohol dehydrogenase family)